MNTINCAIISVAQASVTGLLLCSANHFGASVPVRTDMTASLKNNNKIKYL
jgi:hypothetical protein